MMMGISKGIVEKGTVMDYAMYEDVWENTEGPCR